MSQRSTKGKKQWKLGAKCQRRCTSCVQNNREVVQPPLNNNNDDDYSAANNNESADTTEVDSLFESMGINDNEMIPVSDEELFKQPPPKEDCPICFLRMPSLWTGLKYNVCCGKVICSGCIYASDCLGDQLCPFCRTLVHTSDKEAIKRLRKRCEVNDAQAIYNIGCCYHTEECGLPRDHAKALELWHRAGELGYAQAYNNIGCAYYNGNGVGRDKEKVKHYFRLAAIKGDCTARSNLGIAEKKDGNMDRALKHFMIAVENGHDGSLKEIKELFMKGHTAKEDYEKALRGHQVYVDEIRSSQRDEAASFSDEFKYY